MNNDAPAYRESEPRLTEMATINTLHVGEADTFAGEHYTALLDARELEEAYIESEQNFRNSLEMSPLGICIITSEGELLYANQAILYIYGYDTLEELRAAPVKQRYTPESYAEHLERREKRNRGERIPDSYGISIIRTDGEIRHLQVFQKEIIWDGASQFQLLYQDITERKRAEEALRESEERWYNIFNYAPIGICLSTPDGKILSTNKALETISGYIFKELKNVDIKDICEHPDDMKRLLDMLNQNGRVSNCTIRLKRKDGTSYDALLNIMQTHVKGEAVFQTTCIDITERKRDEEEQQRIARLESIGTLAGGIAHDFNNLLTGIMGNIGLAKRLLKTEGKAYERLDEAEKAATRARALTQQLLTFARGGSPVKKPASITELIKETAPFALRGSNVRLEISLPYDPWTVEVDEGQISQAINNIVINANEAMPAGGTLKIRVRNMVINKAGTPPLPRGNYIQIDIEDKGEGISKKDLPKIFEPYFTTKQKGSGLGLATAYSIISNHGGYITVDTAQNAGTTFHIYLPASDKTPTEKKNPAPATTIHHGGRILVMDDEEVIRKMLQTMLKLAGYEVEVTCDGAEALHKYAQAKESGQPFAAVIMDLTIPGGMGGKEAVKKLLQIDPDVRVIVSSGYATDPIMSEYKKYGFSAVITKPYSVNQLEETIHNLLKKKRG
jgi:PAS domain S-box-containing protein